MTNVLAIDQGTSGTKAIVVESSGEVLATAEEDLRPSYLSDGGVEQDPEAMLSSVLTAGRRAIESAGVTPDAVALANQGETVVAWDKESGRTLSPAIVWQDRRAESICAALGDSAAMVATRTGLVLDPYFSAPKMRWVRDHVTTDGVVTTTDSWLIHQLCGAFVTDVSTASRSLVTDLEAPAWDFELLRLFGLEDEELPKIIACDTVVGETSSFGGSIPVAGLIVDQQAALLAENCLAPGTAKCTFGTGAFLLAQLGSHSVRSSAGLTTSVAWQLRNQTSYCVDGQVYTAASAVRWAIDLGLVTSADQLDAIADAAGESTDGLLSVPSFAGLAAPWWDAQATASFTGLSLGHQRGHLIRSLLEGVAAQVAALIDLVAQDLGQPLTRLSVDGGLTRSRVLMQAQADLAQIPVDVHPSPHATALGAAACARLALDAGLDVSSVVGGWPPEQTYQPRWSADQAADYMDRWQRAVSLSLGVRDTVPS